MIAAPAHASPISLTFDGEGKVATVLIHSPTLGNLNVSAGELEWTWTSTIPAGFDASFYTYCVDANNFVATPQMTTVKDTSLLDNDVAPYNVTDAGGKAAWLVDTYAGLIDQTGTGIEAAGLQVAIWEALYDQTPDLTTGNFYLPGIASDSPILLDANAYLAALFSKPGGGYFTADAVWLDVPARHGQDQIAPLALPTHGPTDLLPSPVPEPITLLTFGSGLAAIAAGRRRRRRG